MAKGVEFDPPEDEVVQVLEACRGMAKSAYTKYKVSRGCFYDYLRKHPRVKSELKRIRESTSEDMMDYAEDTLLWCLKERERMPKTALAASIYILDNKGHTRQWGDTGKTSGEEALRESLGDIDAQVAAMYEANEAGN